MEALILEMASAARPKPGETHSGDACCAIPCAQGTLLAALDALGHGPHAAATVGEAVRILKEGAQSFASLEALVAHCHEALKKTRGVAMSLALAHSSGRALSWTGVGNVEGLLLRNHPEPGAVPRERLLLKGGVVGYQLPAQRVVELTLAPGDALIFATDGLRRDFCEGSNWRSQSCRQMVDSMLRDYDSGADDALVWAVKFGER